MKTLKLPNVVNKTGTKSLIYFEVSISTLGFLRFHFQIVSSYINVQTHKVKFTLCSYLIPLPIIQSSKPDVFHENRRDSNSTWNLMLGQPLNVNGLKGHSIDCLVWRLEGLKKPGRTESEIQNVTFYRILIRQIGRNQRRLDGGDQGQRCSGIVWVIGITGGQSNCIQITWINQLGTAASTDVVYLIFRARLLIFLF